MSLREQIEKALSTTGEWIDDTGTIQIVRVSPDYQWIDILGDRRGQGNLSDWINHKDNFIKVRNNLPPGPYRLNADHPTKAKLYQRWSKGNPLFRLSGETARAKLEPEEAAKLQKKGVSLEYETMTMQVHPPGVAWDKNGLRQPTDLDIEQGLPKSKQEAVERGLNVYEDVDGKAWKLRFKERKKPELINNNEYRLEREGFDTWKEGKRVHHQKMRAMWRDKLLTKQDYLDYAKEHGFSESLALEKYNKNQFRLKSRQLRSGKDTPWILEHLNPQANPQGGVEHWRNNVLWTEEVNAPKSDIIPSQDALRRAGVPMSRQEALALDFADDPGVPTKQARAIILEDIQKQIEAGTTLRARNLRHVGRGLSRNLSGADAALQFASGNYIGGSIGLAMQTPAFQKQIGKALAKTFAKSGAKLLPGVGMSLSTLEAAGYATEGRWTQSGIAALSGVVGEVPLVGDLISAGLDLTNTGIDIVTGNLKPDLDEETLLRKVGRTRI